MIQFDNGGFLVESVDELPDCKNAEYLLADFETTSGHDKMSATNPHKTEFCQALGIALRKDDGPVYYVPFRHDQYDLDIAVLNDWWFDVVDTAKNWVNHNIKYDAHVSANSCGCIPEAPLRLIDTLVLAKLYDSDRFQYGLKLLSLDWLGEDISQYNSVFDPYLVNSKDYRRVPADIMGEYACQDVITNTRLWEFLRQRLPPEVWEGVAQTEIDLTMDLYHAEREGIRVTPQLKLYDYAYLQRMIELDEELTKLVGFSFRPGAPADCFDVLCNQYDLPVMGLTESGNPSFDKHAMQRYAAHVDAPQDVVERIIEYRKIETIHNFFVKPYTELQDENGMMHTDFDQVKRTGRMGARTPNVQQLNKDAKRLIVPKEGEAFLSADYSQIEYRLIIHYIKNQAAIEAYQEDPDRDYHMFVADLCGITRSPAKTVNFMIGFGAGMKKTISALSQHKELVGPFREEAEKIVQTHQGIGPENADYAATVGQVFKRLAKEHATKVFHAYHRNIPELKPTAKRASGVAYNRGYVKNLYGRRRHIPKARAHIAFNTLNQGSAADLMKERAVAVNRMLEGTQLRLLALVHDEFLITGPTEDIMDERTVNDIVATMERPSCLDILRVPIRCSFGRSTESWYDTSNEDKRVPIDWISQNLAHLKS